MTNYITAKFDGYTIKQDDYGTVFIDGQEKYKNVILESNRSLLPFDVIYQSLENGEGEALALVTRYNGLVIWDNKRTWDGDDFYYFEKEQYEQDFREINFTSLPVFDQGVYDLLFLKFPITPFQVNSGLCRMPEHTKDPQGWSILKVVNNIIDHYNTNGVWISDDIPQKFTTMEITLDLSEIVQCKIDYSMVRHLIRFSSNPEFPIWFVVPDELHQDFIGYM